MSALVDKALKDDWRRERERLATGGDLIAYFGYGSLVNRDTLRTKIVGASAARVSGWRREWQPRPDLTLDPETAIHASLLTARRDAAATIDGLLVFDHIENLPAVDLRESDYQRCLVPLDRLTLVDDTVPAGCPVYIYEADPPEDQQSVYPILHSYLDAVLQGFYREHGEEGLRAFIDGTANFQTPILRDRDWPIYPRAVRLADEERILIDTLLEARGVRFVDR
ncbi:gamma-glutamylcyclotransferase [Pararhizobium haloflavum]|uniref:gamma-glutamylcyclotransferase n=1 Tax=Pararhizobium haloflavum TaxID=2037914 RepID=UPI000C174FF9|nr:gamma-glutamylcyclotransferase [Pararhizobium haloflavum]